MLLFRPIMSRYCTIPNQPHPTTTATSSSNPNPPRSLVQSIEDALPQRIALQCSILCVQVAQATVDLIYSNISGDNSIGPLPAWWYNILYVYTAATILLAARLKSQIMSEIPEDSIMRSWRCALEILRKYQEYSTSAKRCTVALEILYDRVVTSQDGIPATEQGQRLGVGADAGPGSSDVAMTQQGWTTTGESAESMPAPTTTGATPGAMAGMGQGQGQGMTPGQILGQGLGQTPGAQDQVLKFDGAWFR